MTTQNLETLEKFRLRARAWAESHLERGEFPAKGDWPSQVDAQRRIFHSGFAGIAVPRQYGGLGLTLEHQRAWAEETAPFARPTGFMVSLGMILPTLLDYGTETVKLRHIPRMLSGQEAWIQLLSEPSGGSDLAGVLTRATRDDDGFVINGSKMWSSNADTAAYGLCLARVDWDKPKHQGLGMFAVPLKGEGVTIEPIPPVQGGPAHFFMEYFDNVRIPAAYRLGDEGAGWAVAQRLLFHERNATAGVAYGYGLDGGGSSGESSWRVNVQDIARQTGTLDDPVLGARVADDHIELIVGRQLAERINAGLGSGQLEGHWGSLLKLQLGIDTPNNAELALALAGSDGVIWEGDNDRAGGELGLNWLKARGLSIAGGSNEIQRNIVSERLLGLPREPRDDRTVPFSELMKRRKSD